MPFADWTKHSDSVNDYSSGRGGIVPPVGAGVNAWNLTAPTTGTAFKRIAYVNDVVSSVSGSHEVSGVFRVSSGVSQIRVGLITMWDGLSLDSLASAYVMEYVVPASGSPTVSLRNGPSELGTLLGGPSAAPLLNNWVQMLIQLKFDSVFNLQLRAAISDAEVEDVTVPSYTVQFDPVVIPRQNARTGGKMAFFVESRQNGFTAEVDHVGVNTTLTVL